MSIKLQSVYNAMVYLDVIMINGGGGSMPYNVDITDDIFYMFNYRVRNLSLNR